MSLLIFGFFVALATASPLPLDQENREPVELIVNGLNEGEPLEIGDIVGIELKHHVDGQLASTSDLLYPLTAEGLAEAAATENHPELPTAIFPALPEPVPELIPQPVDLPEPVLPGVVPEPILLPEPVLPEIVPQPSLPEVDPIILPMPEIEEKPEAVGIPQGEIFNDGNVQVSINVSDQPGVFATIQNWVALVLNYFNNGVQTSQQII